MLVNVHKLIINLFLIFVWQAVQAQEMWTLEQCIDTALVYNKSLQINRNVMSIGTQKQKEAKANLIPKLTANADYTYFMELPTQLMPTNALNLQAPEGQYRNIRFGVPHNISATIQLAMPLYNAQLYGAIKNTKIANELAALQYQKTEEQVLFDVTTLYYNAQILKNQLDFIDHNLINANQLLTTMQLLKDQLLAIGTDVNKVKLQTEQLHTQRDNVYGNYVRVLNALKINMGVALVEEITVIGTIFQSEMTDHQSRMSLDLKIINTQSTLLHSELKILNRSQFLPSLNLVASYGTTGFGYHKSPNEFLDFYTVGFAGMQLSYPLFNGTVTQRKIIQKKLEINNNELQAQLTSNQTEMEIENAFRQRAIAQNTIGHTKSQIDLAQTIYDQTILQQKQGTATLTDVLLADNTLRESQQHYLNALIDFLKADLEIRRLTGTI